MSERTKLRWRVHFSLRPARVYRLLTTDDGRAKFWAESGVERDGVSELRFSNGQNWPSRPTRSVVEYVQGSMAALDLEDDGDGGG